MEFSVAYYIQFAATLVGLVSVVLSFLNWSKMYMRFLFCINIIVMSLSFLRCFAIFFENFGIVASIIMRFELMILPFLGFFFYIFCLDYFNKRLDKMYSVFLPLAVPVVAVSYFAVITAVNLFVMTVEGAVDAGFWIIRDWISGGEYIVNLAQIFVFCVVGCVLITRKCYKSNLPKKSLVVFWLFLALFVVGAVIDTGFPVEDSENTLFGLSWKYTLLCIGSLAFVVFQRMSLRFDWQIMGRFLAVQNMKEGYILLNREGMLIDHNDKAEEYFPVLGTVKEGVALSALSNLPAGLLTEGDGSNEICVVRRRYNVSSVSGGYSYGGYTSDELKYSDVDGDIEVGDADDAGNGSIDSDKAAAAPGAGAASKAAAPPGAGDDSKSGVSVTERLYLRVSHTKMMYKERFIGTCVFMIDNTRSHEYTQQLALFAQYDQLTELYNRRTFYEVAERDYSLHRREKRDGCIIMMDIDFFKRVNDTYGHACGDYVLHAVAEIIRGNTRKTDVTGRYGGEEIVSWLPGTALQGAESLAEKIREIIEETKFKFNGVTLRITLSMGVSAADWEYEPPLTLAGLISNADSALYRAKHSGRNQVQSYHDVNSSVNSLRMF